MRPEGYKRSLTLKAEGEVYKRAKVAYDFAWAKIVADRTKKDTVSDLMR